MPEQTITSMEYDEFLASIDGFIERSSHSYGDMLASVFFELLFERMADRVTTTVELEAEIVDGQLVLHMPVGVETAVLIRNNEILVDNYRIILNLVDKSQT